MRKNILTEKSNPRSHNIDLMNTSEIIHCINKEDQKVARAVAKAQTEITKAVDCMTDCILNDGRVAYFGAGTSGRVGVLDASELLPTYSLPPHIIQGFIAGGDSALRRSAEHAEDSQEFAIKDLNSFNPTSKDVVIGISASGNPAYVLTILQEAQKRGARTIGITCNPQAKLKEFSDICISTAPPLQKPSLSTCLRFTMRERWIRMKSLSGSLRLTDARLKEITRLRPPVRWMRE